MWVGGNATLNGYGVGNQLATCDATKPVLVVGGDLAVSGSVNGRIWVGGRLISGTPNCGGVWSNLPAPVDFAALKTKLTSYSDLLATYPANGTVSSQNGALVLTGSDPTMDVFTVTGAQLSSANGITIKVPATATVIVNVSGATAGFNGGSFTLPDGVTCKSGAVTSGNFCNQLMWNFPNATTVTVNNTGVQGSILAPRATFGGGSGNVNGTVIVNTFALTGCVELHPHYFDGCLCLKAVTGPQACCQ
jgi:choice-of-anchor A domain-containing protein